VKTGRDAESRPERNHIISAARCPERKTTKSKPERRSQREEQGAELDERQLMPQAKVERGKGETHAEQISSPDDFYSDMKGVTIHKKRDRRTTKERSSHLRKRRGRITSPPLTQSRLAPIGITLERPDKPHRAKF